MKKKALLLVLVLCLLACFRPAAAEAYDKDAMADAIKIELDQQVDLTTTKQTFCITVKGTGKLKIEGGGPSDYRANIWNKSGSVDLESVGLAAGISSIQVFDIDGTDTFYIQAAGLARNFIVTFEEKVANGDINTPEVLNIKMGKEVTLETKTTSPEYFLLNPEDKSYYEVTSSGDTFVYCLDSDHNKLDRDSKYYNYNDIGSYTFTACKATPVIIEFFGGYNKKGSVTIRRYDFNEIKTLKFPSSTIKVA